MDILSYISVALLGVISVTLLIFVLMWFFKQWGNHGVDQAKIQSDLNNWKKELSIIHTELNKENLRMVERQQLEEQKEIAEKMIGKLQKALRNRSF